MDKKDFKLKTVEGKYVLMTGNKELRLGKKDNGTTVRIDERSGKLLLKKVSNTKSGSKTVSKLFSVAKDDDKTLNPFKIAQFSGNKIYVLYLSLHSKHKFKVSKVEDIQYANKSQYILVPN
mgnify:CR=1 FL=1